VTPTTKGQERRRRRTDKDPHHQQLATATTKVTLRMALERMDKVMERAEAVLAEEQDDHGG
jgi:hypothetical protein